MAAARPPAPHRHGGSGLSRPSLGGMPLWIVIVGGAVAVFAAYKLYENYKTNAANTAASTTAATTPVDTSGGGASSSPADLTPVEDLASALTGLTAVLGGGGNFTIGPSSSPAASADSTAPAPAAPVTTTSPGVSSPAAQAPTAQAGPQTQGPVVMPFSSLTSTSTGPAAVSKIPVYPGIAEKFTSVTGVDVKAPLIPTPPHSSASLIHPKPKPPLSGYSQKSRANLH